MSAPVQPTPAPNVEMELAKLANEAMQNGADPHEVTGKLHQTLSYLRQFPKMAEHATNALADGVASPADISRTLWPHVQAISHATGSNAPTEEEAANLPGDNTVRSRLGGGLASFAAGIPGGEALTAGAHALVTRQPYRAALQDVQAAEKTSPLKTPLRIAGGTAAMMAFPGSSALSAAREGLAEGVLSANPDQSLDQRLKRGAIQAALNGAIGKAADVATTGIRGAVAKSPAANALARKAGLREVDAGNYGAAEQEAAQAVASNHPKLADLSKTLEDPDIQPFAEKVRGLRKFQGADYATIAMEAFKRMSKQEGGLTQRLTQNGYDIDTHSALENVQDAKQALREAIGQVAPSFEKAVSGHAQGAAGIRAVGEGSDVAKKLMSGGNTAGKKLTIGSPEAFLEKIPTMSSGRAAATAEGALGQVGRSMGPSPKPFEMFGVIPSLAAPAKAAPLVNALDQQAGRVAPGVARSVGTSSADELLRHLGILPE